MAEDRNCIVGWNQADALPVAAILRDGRGSQHPGCPVGRRHRPLWRPSSGMAEDRNPQLYFERGISEPEWRPSSRMAEDRNVIWVLTTAAGGYRWRPSSGMAEDRNDDTWMLLMSNTAVVAAILRGGRGSQPSRT